MVPIRSLACTACVLLFAPVLVHALPFDPYTNFFGVENGAVVWGDYDNDGDLDILMTGWNISALGIVYRNDGGGFNNAGVGLTGVSQGWVDWGDYDQDGDLDALICGMEEGGSRITRLYRNNGPGAFTQVANLTGVTLGSSTFGDYDNDGDLDILVCGTSNGTNDGAWIYRNNGGGSFTDSGSPVGGFQQGNMAFGDYDNDLDLDLIGCGLQNGMASTRNFRNDGNSAFTSFSLPLALITWRGMAAWGDYDSDGDLDLVFSGRNTGSTAQTRLGRNEGVGAGPFVDGGATGLTNFEDAMAAWGDYENDGDLDLLLAGVNAGTALAGVFRCNGGVNYININTGLIGVSKGSGAWGDFDNDGDLDILLVGRDQLGTRTAWVYRNNAGVANSVPSAPTGLAVTASGFTLTFSWNASSDAQTPVNALSYNMGAGTTLGGIDIMAPMSGTNGYRRVARLGNTNENRGWRLNAPKVPYVYWAVQAVDGAFAGGAFATGIANFASLPVSAADIPNDQGGELRVTFASSLLDKANETLYPVAQYGIWRRVDAALVTNVSSVDDDAYFAVTGARRVNGTWIVDGTSTTRRPVDASTRETAAGFPPGTWEWVGTVPALQQATYVASVPTARDAPSRTVFVVTTHTTTPSVWFVSHPDSGTSVDNIAPGVPTGFGVAYNQGGMNHLGWNQSPETDFQYYRIYRGTTPNFIPGLGNLVQSTSDTQWNDGVPQGYLYYYKITALDHAGNESPAASAGNMTAIGNNQTPHELALYANVPNPFNPTTRIRYDLPMPAHVTLRIYDTAGHVVRTLVDQDQSPGHKEVSWDGRDDAGVPVSSGVYFDRLTTPGSSQSRKMVLMK